MEILCSFKITNFLLFIIEYLKILPKFIKFIVVVLLVQVRSTVRVAQSQTFLRPYFSDANIIEEQEKI